MGLSFCGQARRAAFLFLEKLGKSEATARAAFGQMLQQPVQLRHRFRARTMIIAGCRQLYFPPFLGDAGHLLVFPQLPGFSGSDFEPSLKSMEAGSLYRLSNKRTERRLFGVNRALEVFGDSGGRLLNLPRRPVRSGVPFDYAFLRAFFAAASQVAQSGDHVTIFH
ncbi:hypothetical protein FJV76_19025 [Mesorhizobium sp. WSM4303]|uniref:hypothetical protein n=1 Tax=unclassified Mesorhizobium TaxID=325217 RepID=UPI00115CBB74|nr:MULTISPECIES: hypothetical protein [unclassified Mesorhizobium]TRC93086.1 hypothetical protein FJV77_22935 [Mesorhizobium sp. WSM4306]TRD02343.1 hypothetical protein FJV76_19025 [Mesorhizobium sp. WSM4303]